MLTIVTLCRTGQTQSERVQSGNDAHYETNKSLNTHNGIFKIKLYKNYVGSYIYSFSRRLFYKNFIFYE